MGFRQIKKKCKLKMNIIGNIECGPMRELISGLGGCLCKKENCKKVKDNR